MAIDDLTQEGLGLEATCLALTSAALIATGKGVEMAGGTLRVAIEVSLGVRPPFLGDQMGSGSG